jgi:hypothetical protein
LVVPVPGGASRVSGLGVVKLREETLSFNQIVSLETLSAETSGVVSLALVRYGDTGLVRIKDPVLGTDETNLVDPVPGSATKISGLGVVEIREDTFSFLKIVSWEALSAETSGVMSLALVGDGHADLVGVEGPVLGAGEANLVVPVPFSTTRISGLGVVEVREKTESVSEVIALEALGAVTVHGMSLALIGDGHTDLVSIEEPGLWASKADLFVPVPSGASEISGLGVVRIWEDTFSFLKIVSLEALGAVTVSGMSLALIRYSNAGLVSIEYPSVWASETYLVVPIPSSATKVGGLGVVWERVKALSFRQIIALEALGAVTVHGISLALISDGNTDLVSVEGPFVGAGKTHLVGPIPGSTSEIGGMGSISGGVNALSFDDVVSSKAGQAVSWSFVKGVALRADWDAESISIEEASLGAFKASLSRPGLAKEVAFGDNGCVSEGNAISLLNDRAVVAGETFTGDFVPGVAEIAHGDASFFRVEIPSFRAGLADIVGPEGASDVGRDSFVDLRAWTVDDGVSLKALLADSLF